MHVLTTTWKCEEPTAREGTKRMKMSRTMRKEREEKKREIRMYSALFAEPTVTPPVAAEIVGTLT